MGWHYLALLGNGDEKSERETWTKAAFNTGGPQVQSGPGLLKDVS